MHIRFKTIIAAACLGLLPVLAQSEADGPDFFRVTGVASNDVLNIRAAGTAGAEKLGEIPHDANGIRNLGCEGGLNYAEWQNASAAARKAAEKRRWCRVEYRGQTGWVAARFLAEGSADAGGQDVPGHVWRLLALDDIAPLEDPVFVFSPSGSISGTTGCNRFDGQIRTAPGAFALSDPFATTRMACPGPLETQEKEILGALTSGVVLRFDVMMDELILEPIGDYPVMRLQRQP